MRRGRGKERGRGRCENKHKNSAISLKSGGEDERAMDRWMLTMDSNYNGTSIKGEGHVVHAGVYCVCNVCGSANSCGCVVNGSFARAAF